MIVMTLLVRDEEDILAENIRYHLEQGVDHVVITDNLSADATPDIIADFVRQGVATAISETNDIYAQSKWVSRMADVAADMGARWVLHTDADEFWITDSGVPVSTFLRRAFLRNVVQGRRTDFVCTGDAGQPFWDRMIYAKTRSLNPIGRPLPPKIGHRARRGIVVKPGNHGLEGIRWQRKATTGLEILHFPLRSRAQFIAKTVAGGRAYERNTALPESTGRARRAQYREVQETGTTAWLEDNILSDAQVHAGVASGGLVVDERLRGFFGAHTAD